MSSSYQWDVKAFYNDESAVIVETKTPAMVAHFIHKNKLVAFKWVTELTVRVDDKIFLAYGCNNCTNIYHTHKQIVGHFRAHSNKGVRSTTPGNSMLFHVSYTYFYARMSGVVDMPSVIANMSRSSYPITLRGSEWTHGSMYSLLYRNKGLRPVVVGEALAKYHVDNGVEYDINAHFDYTRVHLPWYMNSGQHYRGKKANIGNGRIGRDAKVKRISVKKQPKTADVVADKPARSSGDAPAENAIYDITYAVGLIQSAIQVLQQHIDDVGGVDELRAKAAKFDSLKSMFGL